MTDTRQNQAPGEPFAIQRMTTPEHTVSGKFVVVGPDGKPQEMGAFQITVPGRRVRIEHHFETDEGQPST